MALKLPKNAVFKLLAGLFLLGGLTPLATYAQNARYDNIALTRGGFPAAGATVAVCSQPAVTTTAPCTPLVNLCSSLTDLVCNQPNPTTADGLGNYHFYIVPGTYTIQVYGSGFLTQVLPDQGIGTGGGGGGGGTPALPFNCLQKNLAGVFGAANVCESGTTLAIGDDPIFTGPNPWPDIRSFGARLVNPAIPPATPGITAACVSGNTAITLSSASSFVNGDGVDIWNCGASPALSTPAAPTVTPSVASGPTGSGMVVNSPACATAYQYQIVAVAFGGGYTPAGTAGTTSTGCALGSQSVNITSLSKTANVVTVLTASAHALSVGSHINVQNTTDSTNFGGWYIVATVPDNTHFTYLTPSDTRAGGGATATGGTVKWFNANHVTWAAVPNTNFYLIFGRTGGSMAQVGVSKLQDVANSITDPTWDDFGATMMGTPVFQTGRFPLTPPVSGANNDLVTTIFSGGGTPNLFLNAAPSVTLGSQTILVDAAPAMLAATGNFYIPYTNIVFGTIVVNSFVDLTLQGTGILQQGSLTINSTIKLGTNAQWTSVLPSKFSLPSFANSGGAAITMGTSVPGIFQGGSTQSTLLLSGLNITNQNNAIGTVIDNSGGLRIENVNFGGTGGAEAMTMPLLVRNLTFQSHFSNVTMLGAQSGNSTTPLFFCNSCATVDMDLVNFSGRGIFFNGVGFRIKRGRKQGGTAPLLQFATLSNAAIVGSVIPVSFVFDSAIEDYELDTDPQPLVANVTPTNSGTSPRGISILRGEPVPSADSGGFLPMFSGPAFPGVFDVSPFALVNQSNSTANFNIFGSYGSNTNGHPVYGTSANSPTLAQTNIAENLNISAQNDLTLAFIVPTPVATLTTTCPTSVPTAGAYKWQIAVMGPNGTMSLPSNASGSLTLNGTTQCGALAWSYVQGNEGYKVFVSVNGGGFSQLFAGLCNSFNVNVLAEGCTDNTGTGSGGAPTLNGTGPVALYPNLIATPQVFFGSNAASNYFHSVWSGNFLTAHRAVTIPDASGTAAILTGALTTTHCVQITITAGTPTLTDSGVACFTGTINTGTLGSVPWYSFSGTNNILSPVPGPTVNGFQVFGEQIVASTPVQPTFALLGVPVQAISGNLTLDYTMRANYMKQSGGTTATLTLPQITGATASNYPFVTQNGNSGATTLQANAADKIDGSATGGTQTIPPSYAAFTYQDSSIAPGNWWTLRIPTIAALIGSSTKIASAGYTIPGSLKCVELDSSGNLQIAGINAPCGSGGSSDNLCTNNPAPGAYTPTNVAGATDCLTAGTYTLPTSVTTISSNNVRIIALTPGATIARGSAASGLKFTGNQSGVRGATMDDGAFTSTAMFIEYTGTDNFFEDLIFQNPSATSSSFPTIGATGSATRGSIRRNKALGAWVDPFITVNYAAVGSGTINGIVIDANEVYNFAPTSAQAAIGGQQTSGSTLTNTSITNNKVTGTTANARNFWFLGQAAAQNAAMSGWIITGNQSNATAGVQETMKLFGPAYGTMYGNTFNLSGTPGSPACNMGDFYNFDRAECEILSTAGSVHGMKCTDCQYNNFSVVVDKQGGSNACFLGDAQSNPFSENTIKTICHMTANAIGVEIKASIAGKASDHNAIVDSDIFCNGNASTTGVLFDIASTATGTMNSLRSTHFHNCGGAGSVDINVNNANMSKTYIGPDNTFDTANDTSILTDSGTDTIIAGNPQRKVLAAQYTNSTTTPSNVSGMSFFIGKGQVLTVTCHLYYQAAATGGLNVQWTGPASPTAVIYGLSNPISITGTDNDVATAYSTLIGNVVSTATTNFDATLSFSTTNGTTAGTIQLQAASSAAAQLQIQANSYCAAN